MSNWRTEVRFMRRYVGSGMVNTALGVSTIVVLTWIGLNPFLANAVGYLIGLVSGYLVSRLYTFQSRGGIGLETLRYAAAFGAAYAVNVGSLRLFLIVVPGHPIAGQLIGACCYTATMYAINRFYVFTPHPRNTLIN